MRSCVSRCPSWQPPKIRRAFCAAGYRPTRCPRRGHRVRSRCSTALPFAAPSRRRAGRSAPLAGMGGAPGDRGIATIHSRRRDAPLRATAGSTGPRGPASAASQLGGQPTRWANGETFTQVQVSPAGTLRGAGPTRPEAREASELGGQASEAFPDQQPRFAGRNSMVTWRPPHALLRMATGSRLNGLGQRAEGASSRGRLRGAARLPPG